MLGHHRSCIRFNNVKPRFLKTKLCKMNINSWNIFVTSSQTIIFIVVITTRPLTVCFSFFNYFITSFSFGYNISLEEVPPTQTLTQDRSRKSDYACVIIKKRCGLVIILRVVQTQAILFLKSMSEKSDRL